MTITRITIKLTYELIIDFFLSRMLPYVRLLPEILESGIRVLIYAGDADYICNWIGNKSWAMELDWDGKLGFNFALDKEWYGNQEEKIPGNSYGQLRTHMNFTFLRLYQAGHMVIILIFI